MGCPCAPLSLSVASRATLFGRPLYSLTLLSLSLSLFGRFIVRRFTQTAQETSPLQLFRPQPATRRRPTTSAHSAPHTTGQRPTRAGQSCGGGHSWRPLESSGSLSLTLTLDCGPFRERGRLTGSCVEGQKEAPAQTSLLLVGGQLLARWPDEWRPVAGRRALAATQIGRTWSGVEHSVGLRLRLILILILRLRLRLRLTFWG